MGVNLYDPNKIDGIKNNLLDLHPLWQVSRKKSDSPINTFRSQELVSVHRSEQRK